LLVGSLLPIINNNNNNKTKTTTTTTLIRPRNCSDRYSIQLDVIQQLGQRIENQLRSQESRLTTLPRTEASSLRTTHVKLSRDYRLVEQQFKNVQLDVKRKRSMAEAMQRDAARMEEEEKERGQRGMGRGEDMMAEGKRWQMQIQEDVSVARGDEVFFFVTCSLRC